jgi:hypothetical protein
MSWFARLKNSILSGGAPAPQEDAEAAAAKAARAEDWAAAIKAEMVPSFVAKRLQAAAAGTAPWIATMTPAELLLARSHGIRPIATVSGTCWYHYGYSWTHGHAEGWHHALARVRREAQQAGANAVVDAKLHTTRLPLGHSMDYTLVGTAVRIDGLPPSTDPVVATVPALEFVRLLEAGIVPVGIAIGAEYDWLNSWSEPLLTSGNRPVTDLSKFWETIRRAAIRELHQDVARSGDGVLAHTHLAHLLKFEDPVRILGRFIVIGTVVHTRQSAADALPDIRPVVDMRDDESPLLALRPHGHTAYSGGSHEGGAI